ncbi:MAG: hypothetical protein KF681_09490 [Bdellovibrionaceae bacterium]|nr:hypothetical protein [Pseudobdellovibrionaceae bacterium]
MKRVVLSGLSLIMSVSALSAYAQAPSATVGVSLVGVSGSGGTGFLSAGNYNINQVTQDTTKLMTDAMAHLANVQKIDRDYLLEINTRLLTATKNLIQLGQNFKVLGQQSALSLVKIEDYLKVLNDIRLAEQNFTAELNALTIVTRETLPSVTETSVGGVTATMAATGNLNMEPLVKKYSDMRAALLTELNQVKFQNLITARNQQRSILENALSPDLSGFQILSPEEVQAKTEQMNDLLALNGQTSRLQRQFIERLRNDVRGFVQNYGTDEAFRFRDENDKEAKTIAFSAIQDSFFRRSYLRKKYGIPMGALRTVEYKKSIANLEKFTESFRSLNEYLLMIEPQAAVGREEVLKAFENARNFVQMYDEKVTPVFARSTEIMSHGDKKLEFSSKDTGFLVRANSAITFMTGRQPTAEVLLAVMRMVLADAREEMMLLQNDQAAMNSYHNQRFNSTAETKEAALVKICQIDFSLSNETHAKNCVSRGVKNKPQAPRGLPGNDISGLFQGILNQLELVEKKKALDAENIRQLLIAANAAGNTQSQSQEDDLFQ